jgi:hypothetical protein
LAELERVQETCKSLQEKLDHVDEDAMTLRKAQNVNLERVRRQSELTDEARKRAEAARKENEMLVATLANLEEWTDRFKKGEEGLLMRNLYQEIDHWVRKHYGQDFINRGLNSTDVEYLPFVLDDQPINPSELLLEVHADLSQNIFRSILARFMIGLNDSFGDQIHHIDQNIQRTCESIRHTWSLIGLTITGSCHIWQHWRFALSSAAALLARPDIEADCDRIIRHMEDRFSRYSLPNTTRRTMQLKALLRQCIQFKERLERQSDFYYFWWSSPGRQFREEHMNSPTAKDPSNELVVWSLWPMLFKARPEGELIIENELVKTRPRMTFGSIDEESFYQCSQSSNNAMGQEVPIILLSLLSGVQIVASRALGFNEIPTVVTSLLCDLTSDPRR